MSEPYYRPMPAGGWPKKEPKPKVRKKREYPPPPQCAFPNCERDSAALGLCMAHYAQSRRGTGELSPLRGPKGRLSATGPLEVVSIRLPHAIAEAVHADPGGFRQALEEWARNRPQSERKNDDGIQPAEPTPSNGVSHD